MSISFAHTRRRWFSERLAASVRPAIVALLATVVSFGIGSSALACKGFTEMCPGYVLTDAPYKIVVADQPNSKNLRALRGTLPRVVRHLNQHMNHRLKLHLAPGDHAKHFRPRNNCIVIHLSPTATSRPGLFGQASPELDDATGRIVGGKVKIFEPSFAHDLLQEVLLHELGHALGLDHYDEAIDGRTQIMHRSHFHVPATLGVGDIRGLRHLAHLENGQEQGTITPVIARSSLKWSPTKPSDPIMIYGSGFTGATSLLFGLAPAKFDVVDDSHILAWPPDSPAGSFHIHVVTPDATSRTTAASRFHFANTRPNTKPLLVQPNGGPASGGLRVQILCEDATAATEVLFDNVPALDVRIENKGLITATVPPGVSGPATVSLVNPWDRPQRCPRPFTYYPGPEVTEIKPTKDPGAGDDQIVIRGTRFLALGPTQVTFGNVPASNVRLISDSEIIATVPQLPDGSHDVIIRTSLGDSTPSPASQYCSGAAPSAAAAAPPPPPRISDSPVDCMDDREILTGPDAKPQSPDSWNSPNPWNSEPASFPVSPEGPMRSAAASASPDRMPRPTAPSPSNTPLGWAVE